jgi:glutaconate CoA-transferase subunit B
MTPDTMGSWTSAELMAVVMARQLRPGEVAVMGAVSLLPQAACRLAEATSAPGLWWVAGGSGAVNPHPGGLVESSCDQRLLAAESSLPLPEVVLLEGRGDVFDVFFAGGLQIDARGSCNLVAIGDWSRPRLRGPGGVGLSFLPRADRVVIYTASHTPRTFVERVDFVSGPGYVDGLEPGRGPSLVVTPLCTIDFAPVTHAPQLRTLHPGVSVDEVRSATGFELVCPRQPPVTPQPTAAELHALREVDSAGLLRSEPAQRRAL